MPILKVEDEEGMFMKVEISCDFRIGSVECVLLKSQLHRLIMYCIEVNNIQDIFKKYV